MKCPFSGVNKQKMILFQEITFKNKKKSRLEINYSCKISFNKRIFKFFHTRIPEKVGNVIRMFV